MGADGKSRVRLTLLSRALDPFGKIPEFKFCAVNIAACGALMAATGYGV